MIVNDRQVEMRESWMNSIGCNRHITNQAFNEFSTLRRSKERVTPAIDFARTFLQLRVTGGLSDKEHLTVVDLDSVIESLVWREETRSTVKSY